ncbi:MAG: glycogen debranching enzyme N-terminal domain-containing protein [Candidatus Bathyarchaeota archaeon]|nr:glycogen debranching enzyme N-terminal domain-containing protein [Candidatus Bathyarchaeota archaeon]
MPAITIHKEALSKVGEALEKEWIITNGLGGYASSTVLGVNTRKYHGLLVAAFQPPRDRRLCLAKLDEELTLGVRSHPLFSNEFQSGFSPKGYMHLKEFSLSPFPRYVYAVENVEVHKTIFMPYRKNAVIALYEVFNGSGLDSKIRVFPLITCRHFHSVVDRGMNPPAFRQEAEDKRVEVKADFPPFVLAVEATDGLYLSWENWVEGVYFREEFSRGESFMDDWFQPGFFEISINGSGHKKFALIACANRNENCLKAVLKDIPNTIHGVEKLYNAELARAQKLLSNFYREYGGVQTADWLSWIVLAADAFVVEVAENLSKSIIAGYHWFEDWGRDAFISLPGLMLVTGKFEDARQTFLTFKRFFSDGLIPNYVSDRGAQPAYNSVDATLWYVNAVLQYLKYTGDLGFVKMNLWEELKIMVECFVKGTAFNIRVDGDGLLLHGPQLTWMDAAVDGKPVTPRAGKAVEVQALWYNALKTLEVLAGKFGETEAAENFARLAEKARKSFMEKFWNAEGDCLFDVVDERGRGDPTIRPNQIIAVSLDFQMLDGARGEKVVDFVRRELLTPYGLRTLSKGDPRYVGAYYGDRRTRDSAYHNGTVWPWLLGPFTTAYLKTKGYTENARQNAFENFLLPLFKEQVFRAGLGTLSEIFDGDPPHNPRGCIAQAWSIAEPLRAYVEDVMLMRPRYEREILATLSRGGFP